MTDYTTELPLDVWLLVDRDPDAAVILEMLNRLRVPPRQITAELLTELLQVINELHPCECDRCARPLRDFIQVDGWANMKPGDPIMVPDSDGDVLCSGRTREPQRSGTTVRVLIAADAERADVLRVIRKQLAWIEREPNGALALAEDLGPGREYSTPT